MPRTALAALVLLVAACADPATDTPSRPASTTTDTTISPAEAALSRAQRLDERLPYASARVRTLPAEGAREERVLRLWRDGNRPVKITATEPDDAGRMTGLSAYYFDEHGELFFVRHPHARYTFRNGRLDAWLDERLQPVDVPEADRAAREASIRGEARRYLAAFGLSPGDA